MKLSISSTLLCFAAIVTLLVADSRAQELNITNTDVFVQSGEATASSVIIMARCNRERDSSVTVFYAPQGSSEVTRTGLAYRANDYTVKILLSGLLSNTVYNYRVQCAANSGGGVTQNSFTARFRTLPSATEAVDLSFVWAADLAGQGWGRNPDLNVTTINGTLIKGGYLVFQVMESFKPDFAFFQGDMIYADNAIFPNKTIPAEVGGGFFNNNPTKPFVAQTLDEFRFNWKYNFGDDKMQSFLSKTPVYVQWDDHEVINNWFPSQVYSGPLIPNGTAIDSLAENSLQAFYEFNPIPDGTVIYRSQRFGKHLEVFFVDLRSYRAPNPRNSDTTLVAMMGPTQLAWLKDRLLRSTATHKVLLVVLCLMFVRP
jgi:alkaline phosphatase D